jgi:hypothetical protein
MLVFIRKDYDPMDIDIPPATDQSQCRLLQLPAELRTEIWRLLLLQRLDEACVHPPGRFCAKILSTCRQINAEGTPILYGENIFLAHYNLLATLPHFLLQTQPRRISLLNPVKFERTRRLIKRYFIFVRLDTDPRYTRQEVEESFNGVEELEMEVFQSSYMTANLDVLRLYEGVRGVGKVTITGSLGDGKYANWLAKCMQLPPGSPVEPYWEQFIGGQQFWNAWTNGNR